MNKILGIFVHSILVVIILTLFLATGCPQKECKLCGSLALPQGATLQNTYVAAIMNGKEVASVPVEPSTGKFDIPLPGPGTYDIRLKTPKGNIEFAVAASVEKGQMRQLEAIPAPVDLFENVQPPPQPPQVIEQPATPEVQAANTTDSTMTLAALLEGTVHPSDADVKVMSEGKVVAEAKAQNGKFKIPSVPAGTYDIEYSAPGYATAYKKNVQVTAKQSTRDLNGFLLYRSPLDGIDWDKGAVTATGLGKPNPGMSAPQAGLMACQAAKVLAYRNLLNTLLKIQVDPYKTIAAMDKGGTIKTGLTGYIKGAKMVAENKHSDGTCEITLEMPLNGAGGVTSFVQEQLKK